MFARCFFFSYSTGYPSLSVSNVVFQEDTDITATCCFQIMSQCRQNQSSFSWSLGGVALITPFVLIEKPSYDSSSTICCSIVMQATRSINDVSLRCRTSETIGHQSSLILNVECKLTVKLTVFNPVVSKEVLVSSRIICFLFVVKFSTI